MIGEILYLGARSVTIETDTSDAYARQGEGYRLLLNGEFLRNESRNVFSLFNLLPETEYLLSFYIGEEPRGEIKFTTEHEPWTIDVRRCGAVGDGIADDTQALQTALYSCPQGGRVLIPQGVYNFTSLFFKSHTRIELQKDAVLRASVKREGRGILPGLLRCKGDEQFFLGSWEGNPLDCYAGLLTLIDVEDVVIYGEGVLDGAATKADWWREPKIREGAWRPRAVFMRRCRKVTLQGITVMNSPSWTVHPLESEQLDFLNVRLNNPWDSPNTDGIDPESCTDVRIMGCHFSLGDDCIAIKAGKIYMAETTGRATSGVLVRNCLMEDGHGGVTIGSEMAGGVYDVTVERCIFRNTDRGLRIKTRRGRGRRAVIDQVRFSDISMQNVLTPFVLNMFYFCDPDGHSDYVQNKTAVKGPSDQLPRLGRFLFERIQAEGEMLCGIFAYGLPEQPIEEIVMRDVTVHFRQAKSVRAVKPAMLDDNDWSAGDILYLKNILKVELDSVILDSDLSDENVVMTNIGSLTASEDSVLPKF